EPIPIGRAIDNVEVFTVAESGRLTAGGEEGELYVRGNTVAHGYWGDRERTARSFVTNPLTHMQDRVYRTGDLVRCLPDGNLAFLGRKDQQIKSRGYRIELGDIEAALAGHPGVAECAVIAIPDEVVGNRIKAFVVVNDSTVRESELVKFCAGLLPRYMIPEFFEFIAVLPKTSTGKTDRKALDAPAVPVADHS
ncbi:MAG: AMP-binding enzyme, partial [Acidimicrobiia bacterium]